MSMRIQFIHRTLLIIFISVLTCTYVMAHGWMAPKQYSKMSNPIVQDGASVARGEMIFIENCAVCHGEDAKGLSAEETQLEIHTPNLLQRLATHSAGDFFWKIQEGRGEMPSFKKDIDEDNIWDIINFIKAAE